MAYSYKCPNCAANLLFDPDAKRMACGFCDAKISPHDLISKEGEEGFLAGEQWVEAMTYTCGNCDAAIIAQEDVLTEKCVYCDSPVILSNHLNAGVRPTKIIPFRFGKQSAQEEAMKWLNKRKFLPGKFARQLKIEGLKGVYIPVWLCDYLVKVNMTDYAYITPKTVNGLLLWEKVPIDASFRINQNLMERIEPYNYNYLQSFEPQYMSGFLAEKPQMEHDKIKMNGFLRVKEFLKSAISNMGISVHSSENSNVFCDAFAEFALLPVWFVKIKYRGKIYTMVVNGQTGVVAADLPTSKLRVFLLSIGFWMLIVWATLILTLGLIGVYAQWLDTGI